MPAIPTTAEQALIYVVVAVIGVIVWLLRGMFKTLTNHFKHDEEALREIAAHMAEQNEHSRAIMTRLLDAVVPGASVKMDDEHEMRYRAQRLAASQRD